jgi:hypothetical protein
MTARNFFQKMLARNASYDILLLPSRGSADADGESLLTDVVRDHKLTGQPNSILTCRVEKDDSAVRLFFPEWEMRRELRQLFFGVIGRRLLFEN